MYLCNANEPRRGIDLYAPWNVRSLVRVLRARQAIPRIYEDGGRKEGNEVPEGPPERSPRRRNRSTPLYRPRAAANHDQRPSRLQLEADFKLRNRWNVKVNSNLKPVREYFGHWRAVDVTTDVVTEYIERMRDEEYSAATVNRRTQLLSQAYKLALRTKKLSCAPHIPRLSEIGNERQGFFETEHLEAVLKHLPEYLSDFVRCGFMIGWRKGALQSLSWTDVTEDVIYLRALNSKTRKPESVPLEGELGNIIERRRAAAVWQSRDGQAHFSEYVFHNEGRPIGDFRKAWATACCAVGVGKLVCPECRADVDDKRKCSGCRREWTREDLKYIGAIFHDFRRTAARNLLRAGVPVPVAMKITGHRTDSMFRRYAIVDEQQKRDALAKTQLFLATAAGRKVVQLKRAAKA